MSELPCVLCNHSTDDPIQLGEKLTSEDTTAHLYCLLLTSNLVQGGEDDEGLYGFMPKDIKSEVWRTKKLFCHYCQQRGASIGCCVKSCRRSFHLPCALEQDCRLEFSQTFRSFCDEHHNIKKPRNAHRPTDLCTVCYDEMGKFNIIRSIPLACCNKNAWCHKLCLQKYAQTSGYFLKCPLCNDSKKFRDWIAERGVFIPDRDAKWEIDETGPNTFYGFEQHSERPTSCVAKVCKCPNGRNYQVETENHKYSLVFCEYCGSLAVHLKCLDDDDFRCDDCNAVIIRTQAQATTSNPANGIAGSSSGNNEQEKYRTILSKFDIPDCYVRLIRLNAEDFCSKSKLNYQKYMDLSAVTKKHPTNSAESIVISSSSSDENEIQPILRKTGKINAYFLPVSDSDSDIEIAPVGQALKPQISTDSDSDYKNKLVNNANGTQIGLNSQQTKPKSPSNTFIERKLSSSEDEPNRPSVIIRNFFQMKSSDGSMAGKENEKPSKTIAVVRPFTLPETSLGLNCNIKTEKYPCSAFYPTSSSSGQSDDSTYKSTITQRYDYLPKNIPKTEKPSTYIESHTTSVTKTETTTATTTIFRASSATDDAIKRTPNKRKYRSVRSYFRDDTSSSDDEVAEPKPKRKSPKQFKRNASAHVERPPNQSTIVNFFQRKLNQGIQN